jgi:hypothetical protein
MPTMSNNTQYDSVNYLALPDDTTAFAAYNDGLYTDYQKCKERFPHALSKSVTVYYQLPGNFLDVENGDATIPEAVEWWKNYKDKGAQGIYIEASLTGMLNNTFAEAGFAREEYLLWSAHYGFQHICSPNGCGYPTADATQWYGGKPGTYDISEYTDKFYDLSNPTTPPTKPPTIEKSDDMTTFLYIAHSSNMAVKKGDVYACTVETGVRVHVGEDNLGDFEKKYGAPMPVAAGTITAFSQ